MKLLIPAAIAVMFSLVFTSCQKRDYSCSCKLSNGDTQDLYIGRVSNNVAQEICEEEQVRIENKIRSAGISAQCSVIH